jgi:hypothetical protein
LEERLPTETFPPVLEEFVLPFVTLALEPALFAEPEGLTAALAGDTEVRELVLG